MNTEIAQYAHKLISGNPGPANCDMNSSCVHLVQAPIARELFDDLKAVAAMHGRDTRCIAGDLLSLAIKDMFASMPTGKFEEIKATRKEYDKKAAQKHMEEQLFNAGGS